MGGEGEEREGAFLERDGEKSLLLARWLWRRPEGGDGRETRRYNKTGTDDFEKKETLTAGRQRGVSERIKKTTASELFSFLSRGVASLQLHSRAEERDEERGAGGLCLVLW